MRARSFGRIGSRSTGHEAWADVSTFTRVAASQAETQRTVKRACPVSISCVANSGQGCGGGAGGQYGPRSRNTMTRYVPAHHPPEGGVRGTATIRPRRPLAIGPGCAGWHELGAPRCGETSIRYSVAMTPWCPGCSRSRNDSPNDVLGVPELGSTRGWVLSLLGVAEDRAPATTAAPRPPPAARSTAVRERSFTGSEVTPGSGWPGRRSGLPWAGGPPPTRGAAGHTDPP